MKFHELCMEMRSGIILFIYFILLTLFIYLLSAMIMQVFYILLLAFAVHCAPIRAPRSPERIIDMTHPHGNKTLYWPGAPGFNFNIVHRGELLPGLW